MGSNYQQKVREFQIASGQPVNDTPYEMTKEERDFRENLLMEEIRELREAIVDNNHVEILDALCDIKYVNDGTANMIGVSQDDKTLEEFYVTPVFSSYNQTLDAIGRHDVEETECINTLVYDIAFQFSFTLENFKTALDRVHASNMSKFCYDTKTAEKTQEFYRKQGIDTYIEPVNKMTVVYRKGDGKVLKSVNFHPVHLNDLV